MICVKRNLKWGESLVAFNVDAELIGLWFQGQKYFPKNMDDVLWIEEDEATVDQLVSKKIKKVIKEFDRQMSEYQAGTRKEFNLPLSPVGSSFRQLVWEELLKIPLGETTTYGCLSKKIAAAKGLDSMSAQAVGGAVGHNPISIIIPCHRVVGASGQLTGYAGGIDKKTALLQHEGISVNTQSLSLT